jgi:hypothetical protein
MIQTMFAHTHSSFVLSILSIMISLLSILIIIRAYPSYKKCSLLADKLFEKLQKEFYEEITEIVLDKLRSEFNTVGEEVEPIEIREKNFRASVMNKYYESELPSLREQVKSFFSKETAFFVVSFFDDFKKTKVTKEQYQELCENKYACWFYQHFEKFIKAPV